MKTLNAELHITKQQKFVVINSERFTTEKEVMEKVFPYLQFQYNNENSTSLDYEVRAGSNLIYKSDQQTSIDEWEIDVIDRLQETAFLIRNAYEALPEKIVDFSL